MRNRGGGYRMVSKAIQSKRAGTGVLDIIKRIDRLKAHQARVALRVFVANNPPSLYEAIKSALDIAESYP